MSPVTIAGLSHSFFGQHPRIQPRLAANAVSARFPAGPSVQPGDQRWTAVHGSVPVYP
jgi:hypothetical protein